MTLHWWMHWFWITAVIPIIVSLILAAAPSSAAPFYSPIPEFTSGGTLTPLDFSRDTSDHPNFHHDSTTLYVALLHDSASPTAFADDFADDRFSDTPSPSSLFPLHIPDPNPLHEVDGTYSQHSVITEMTPPSHNLPLEHDIREENHTSLDVNDNPMNEELLSSDENEKNDGNTKMFARDISLSSRSGKAIGREYIPSTSAPDIVTTDPQISNRNPFIDKQNMETSSGSGERLEMPIVKVPVTLPPPTSSNNEEHEDEIPVKEVSVVPADKQKATLETETTTPPAETASSSAAPDIQVKSHSETNLPPQTTAGQAPEISSAPIPPWVPSFSSEEESAEEAEAEENLRPELSLADQQASAEVEANSEAVTRGRMTAEQGLDASSIVGIVLGLVGLVSIVGGAVGFMLYRRRFLNKPQTLNDKCSNADSSGYIDDTLRVSATHTNSGARGTSGSQEKTARKLRGNKGRSKAPEVLPHPKDNSEEMYSLDNDSFLNSLEAMTIQNYWTDSVKHTKL